MPEQDPLVIVNPVHTHEPLDEVQLEARIAGRLEVWDGEGTCYLSDETEAGKRIDVTVSGALGTHQAVLFDTEGRLVARVPFRVDCRTHIEEDSGQYTELLKLLYLTLMQNWRKGGPKTVQIEGKVYHYYVSWLRDHVHSLKGMKYFDGDIKTGIELYADSQREDGMIWDKCKEMFQSDATAWRDVEFAEGDFIRPIPGNPTRRWQRVPVENDVEYLFLEGLYYTWKACGDTQWMSQYLDNAIRAIRYSTSDIYRWSEKYRLLKRGYTIDTWDFQHKEDIARSGSAMRVYPDKTVFGVMHGDNTGMAVGCSYLAEMLEAAGRSDEGREFRELGETLLERLNALSWNGEFYTHHVSEQPEVTRETGVDESRQVSLSNAYNLNRRIGHEKCAAIIETYQRIRREMPESSPGEFYSIFPPFEKGFHTPKWDYVNGGVLSIVAGELAHGAFENGFEDYGADILERELEWTRRLGGYLHCALKGKMPERKEARFSTVSLREVANVDFHGDQSSDVPGWIGEKENDFRHVPVGKQSFHEVEFEIVDPAENDRRGCLGLSSRDAYADEATVPVNAKAASIYFLHALSGGSFAGWFTVEYTDGSEATQYVRKGESIGDWFMPPKDNPFAGGNQAKQQGNLRLAWQGPNGKFDNVGTFLYGWNNPHPEKEIRSIRCVAAQTGATWLIQGITLSDTKVQLPTSPVSFGIPDMWGCAAVLYALVEGLAGVVDSGVAFDHATVSPRWASAGVKQARVAVHYPASNGYSCYHYEHDEGHKRIAVRLATSNARRTLRVLLPAGVSPTRVTVDGRGVDYEVEQIRESRYIVVSNNHRSASVVRIEYE